MASIKDLKRMCKSFDYCEECVLKRKCGSPASIDEAVEEIVEKWVEEHPVKTYAMDFFEKFPNAQKDRNGAPMACWKHIYGGGNDCVGNCIKCWNQEVED